MSTRDTGGGQLPGFVETMNRIERGEATVDELRAWVDRLEASPEGQKVLTVGELAAGERALHGQRLRIQATRAALVASMEERLAMTWDEGTGDEHE